MKYHPDRTKGDKTSEEKFKVNEAYEILTDERSELLMTNMVTKPLLSRVDLVVLADLVVDLASYFW